MSGDQLLARVLAAPDEDAPRLAYADYLMGQSDPRGDYIAVQVQLQQKITPARRRHARERLEALAHHDFGAEAAALVSATDFDMRRGFIDALQTSGSAFAEGARVLLAIEPLRHVTLNGLSDTDLERLLEDNVIGRLAGLRIIPPLGDGVLAKLAASAQLRSLRRLNLTWCPIGNQGLELLSRGGNLEVASLTLNDCDIGDAGVEALAGSESMRYVKQLFLSRNHIGNAGAAALALSPHIHDMVVISIGGNPSLGDWGGRAFADRELAAKLRRLEMVQTELGDDTASALGDVWGDRLTL